MVTGTIAYSQRAPPRCGFFMPFVRCPPPVTSRWLRAEAGAVARPRRPPQTTNPGGYPEVPARVCLRDRSGSSDLCPHGDVVPQTGDGFLVESREQPRRETGSLKHALDADPFVARVRTVAHGSKSVEYR